MTAGSASDIGRFPANVIHDGSDDVLAAFPSAPGALAPVTGNEPSASTGNAYGKFDRRAPSPGRRETDKSAARFFYCAKASKTDRDEGNVHPTVKPTDLMRYLCRLVTPAGGVILDPFAGSGSTGKAAILEGFHFIGFEQDASYAAIANARIEVARK
jgi:site-specific DNA-methyltransferase (adenine-specific)